MPFQYTAIIQLQKVKILSEKVSIVFLQVAQNIGCWYKLERSQQGGCNEYPQSMFWIKNKKDMDTLANTSFSIYKCGV